GDRPTRLRLERTWVGDKPARLHAGVTRVRTKLTRIQNRSSWVRHKPTRLRHSVTRVGVEPKRIGSKPMWIREGLTRLRHKPTWMYWGLSAPERGLKPATTSG